MKKKIVKEKGKLDRYKFEDVKPEHLILVKNDKVIQADAESTKEFDFVQFVTGINGTYAHCRDNGTNRYFYSDSIAKSPRVIKSEKRLTKKLRKNEGKKKRTTKRSNKSNS